MYTHQKFIADAMLRQRNQWQHRTRQQERSSRITCVLTAQAVEQQIPLLSPLGSAGIAQTAPASSIAQVQRRLQEKRSVTDLPAANTEMPVAAIIILNEISMKMRLYYTYRTLRMLLNARGSASVILQF